MTHRAGDGMRPIAHTAIEAGGPRHDLIEHLVAVADLAGAYSAAFDGAQLGHWAGIWHDIGKFHPEFQQYLLDAETGQRRRGPDHKAAGVILAASYCEALAAPLQGHHGGLRDRSALRAWVHEKGKEPRVAEAIELARAHGVVIEPNGSLPLPEFLKTPTQLELFLRMLFSALVDADFLDTERHFAGGKGIFRGGYPTISELWGELQASQATLSGARQDVVSQVRHQVYQSCLAAASEPAGLFRLTVPTGGGKTRSSLAFALQHALTHGLDRVIVAVPYTSITDQTATTYREIFNSDRAVLEHHSAIDQPFTDNDEAAAQTHWNPLASQNWDAPLIVTTTVQLFESLFARSTSKCRKLHNIANSVIILDEVQTLPERLLKPTLDILQELVRNYGTTVVLSTATQPALDQRKGFGGLEDVREIVPDPEALFRQLRRVNYEWEDVPREWVDIAAEMSAEAQAMAVVNTKADAMALLGALDDPAALHLSTSLCGAHRKVVLDKVHRRLNSGEPCLLVATQVVEAGVDLDFPLVLRALGPLDRIVQAAGRCNREGRLDAGRVIVFRPADGGTPPGAYKTGTDIAAMLLADAAVDFHDPRLYERYFEALYARVELDAKKIQPQREGYNYEEVARRYRLIPDDTTPLVTPYAVDERAASEREALLDALRTRRGNPRDTWRQLQPYIVNVRKHELDRYVKQALAVPVVEGLYQWVGEYDKVCGLVPDRRRADELVI